MKSKITIIFFAYATALYMPVTQSMNQKTISERLYGSAQPSGSVASVIAKPIVPAATVATPSSVVTPEQIVQRYTALNNHLDLPIATTPTQILTLAKTLELGNTPCTDHDLRVMVKEKLANYINYVQNEISALSKSGTNYTKVVHMALATPGANIQVLKNFYHQAQTAADIMRYYDPEIVPSFEKDLNQAALAIKRAENEMQWPQ